MSIFYPTPSSCSPLPTYTAHLAHPTPYQLLLFLSLREPLKKVHYTRFHPDLWNESVPSGFDGSLPPLVYLEVQPSSHVDGAIVVNLEGLVRSTHCEDSVGAGMMIIE